VHGWIVIDKPVGPGSTQIVGAVKRALREGGYPKVKVGHGGTLDPLASGVLPIALGEATKLSGRMLDADKVYEFTIAFGAETDTLDLEGRSSPPRSASSQPMAEIEAILPLFTGAIDQVPPAYSALKVDGKRAYDPRGRSAPAKRWQMKSRRVPPCTGEDRRGRLAGKGEVTLLRPRLQGHLYPQPRPRHRPRPRKRRPRRHVAADQGRPLLSRTGDFAGQIGRKR
jgi:tRNA pseudouridine55 synthase